MGNQQQWSEMVVRAMNWSRDRVEDARLERQRRNDPVLLARAQRQAALVQRAQAEQAQVMANQRHANWLHRLHSRATTGLYVAAGSAGLGTVDLIGMAVTDNAAVVPPGAGLWFVAAAVSGLIGARARARLKSNPQPLQVALPPVPPPLLPPGSVGAEEAQEIYNCEARLIAMIPAVDQLLPEAGLSLRQTLHGVQPRLHGVVERLEVLASIDVMRAPQAAEAAETLRRVLIGGVESYDHLINATATLLAAPDPRGGATQSLAIATQELEAYAAGLAAASDAFDGQ